MGKLIIPTKTKDVKFLSPSRCRPTAAFKEWLKENKTEFENETSLDIKNHNVLSRLAFWFETECFGDFGELTAQEIEKIYRESMASTKGASHDKMVKTFGKYGEEKWKEYCERQAETNTFEFKHQAYGMTESEFNEYNASRAVTKENLIRRHGATAGIAKWEAYCERQRFTKSQEYLIEIYGEEEGKQKWKAQNALKSNTLENFIRRYGEEDGTRKCEEYHEKLASRTAVSNMEIMLIERIRNFLTPYEDETSETQYTFYGDTPIIVDFYNKNLKMVVEFFGNYWHANPKMYKGSFKVHGTPATTIWVRDKKRIEFLKNHPDVDEVFIVWESEAQEKIEEIFKYVESKRT